jgi:hypothetical protein
VQPLPKLRTITLANLPRLHEGSLDSILGILPQIETLSVSIDYISADLFDFRLYVYHEKSAEAWPIAPHLADDDIDDDAFPSGITSATRTTPQLSSQVDRAGKPLPQHAALQTLILTNSGNPGASDRLTPVDIMLAMDEGCFPDLATVHVANSLNWQSGVEENTPLAREVASLDEALRSSVGLSERTNGNEDGESAGWISQREEAVDGDKPSTRKGARKAGVFFFHG